MKLLVISLILTLVPLFLETESPWQATKSGHGVVIFTRSVKGTPIKEIKAELEINCSLNSAVACLEDVEAYTQWIYQMSQARIVKHINPQEIQVYQIVKTPWPLNNRDVCGQYLMKQDPNTMAVSILTHSVPKILPEVAGMVRVQKNRTNWVMKPLAKNKIKVEYFLVLDPAGDVPAWIINLFISEGPYSSLVKLKQRVILPKYARVTHPWVTEKFP